MENISSWICVRTEVACNLIDKFTFKQVPSVPQFDNRREFAKKIVLAWKMFGLYLKFLHDKLCHKKIMDDLECAIQNVNEMLSAWIQDKK
jgi:hypothetical protein